MPPPDKSPQSKAPSSAKADGPGSKPRSGLWFARAVIFALNCCLLALLGLQIFLATHLEDDGSFRLPNGLHPILENQLSKAGLSLAAAEVRFDANGRIQLHQVEIYHVEASETPWFQAQSVFLKINRASLLVGNFTPLEATVDDARIQLPARFSPSGQTETVLSELSLNLQASTRQADWTITRAQGRLLGTMPLLLTGQIPGVDDTRKSPQAPLSDGGTRAPAKRPVTGDSQLFRGMRRAVELHPVLAAFEQPHGRVELRPGKGTLEANGTIAFQGFASPASPLRTGASRLSVTLQLQNNNWETLNGTADLEVDALDWEDGGLSAAHAHITTNLVDLPSLLKALKIPLRNQPTTPSRSSRATLSLSQIRWDTAAFTTALAEISLEPDQTTLGTGMLSDGDGNFLKITDARRAGDALELAIETNWAPARLLKLPPAKSISLPADLELPRQHLTRADLLLDSSLQLQSVALKTQARQLRYRTIQLESAQLEAQITPRELFITNADLATSHYRVTGSYWQHLKTRDYRFLLSGTIDPRDLNGILREHWWQELWADFQFEEALPQADLEISGRYGGGRGHRLMYGSIELPRLSFRGVPLDGARARLWSRGWFLRLLDFEVDQRGDDGKALLDLEFRHTPERRGRLYASFRGHTTLPLEQAAIICGPETVAVTEDIQVSGNTSLDVSGIVLGSASPRPGATYLRIGAAIDGPFTYHNVPMQDAHFALVETPELLQIRDGHFTFMGGKATLAADLIRNKITQTPPTPANTLRIAGTTEGADFQSLTAFLQNLNDTPSNNKAVPAASDNGHQVPKAKADFTLFAEGPVGNFSAFKGEADFKVSGSDLLSLHTLGGVSRILSHSGVPLGRFSFGEATSRVSLKESILEFPDIVLKGDTARISGNGHADLASQQVDFRFRLNPFAEVETPVVGDLLNVITPLSAVFEIEVDGTINTPEYRVTVLPFKNIFSKEKPAIEGAEPNE